MFVSDFEKVVSVNFAQIGRDLIEYTTDELIEFIKDLDTKSYDKIKSFISTTPHLLYEIKYQNSKGTERKIALTTLTDFFTLR